MHPKHDQDERRRYPRVKMAASAIVLAVDQGHSLHVVENLSAGGASLVGNVALKAEEEITVFLIVGECMPLKVCARIVHCRLLSENRWQTGISFVHNSAETEDVIQDMVLKELDRIRANPSILVLSSSKAQFRTFERDCWLLGRRVLYSSKSLDVAWLLQDPGVKIDIICIDMGLVGEIGHSILDFLEANYPEIRRVLIIDDEEDMGDFGECSFHAHAVLKWPLHPQRLTESMGLEG